MSVFSLTFVLVLVTVIVPKLRLSTQAHYTVTNEIFDTQGGDELQRNELQGIEPFTLPIPSIVFVDLGGGNM